MLALSLDMGGTHIGCAVVRDREIEACASLDSEKAASLTFDLVSPNLFREDKDRSPRNVPSERGLWGQAQSCLSGPQGRVFRQIPSLWACQIPLASHYCNCIKVDQGPRFLSSTHSNCGLSKYAHYERRAGPQPPEECKLQARAFLSNFAHAHSPRFRRF